MNLFNKTFLVAALACSSAMYGFSQSYQAPESQPTDYLTPAFHAGRRQALRDMMPANSVAVIFAYPERVFSKDVNFVYHPNPDLYYFSGYKEPDAVLLVFKEMQSDADGSYNELIFVRHRDPAQESWTGRRLGVEGTKAELGFKRVYNSEEFAKFPIDYKKFKTIIYDDLDNDDSGSGAGGLKNLIAVFKEKTGLKSEDKGLQNDLNIINNYATPKNLDRIIAFIKPRADKESYKNNELIQELMNKPDSATLMDVKAKIAANPSGTALFDKYTNDLRGTKTPEELALVKKAVVISSIAHAEAMRAVKPSMSERELEGVMRYVHDKYGAEEEGYPPIVGAGANGCILHYEENNATEVKNQLVLMDVGAMYHGYSADVTRTFPANGKFTEEQKAIYNAVYDAQEEVFKLCKEGVNYSDLETKTREVLSSRLIALGLIKDAKEVGKYYPHGVSHHIGLDVHDKGGYGVPLKAGMVITVEPGIYIPAGSPCDKKWWNIGVRIEDDVQIGKDAGILLSGDAPRKWQDVEKTVAEKSIFDAGKFPALK
ncbi:MAG: aminopeptidase P N-terminal domain-containing protein [Mucilaginibacter sp.]|uniref:aminopeptidase P family protein n=1 Tax=Mucilaginibacter sp. L3T2-6 TaxID=3062491 RepID=UPI0026772CF9|nr:aminopeptidase P family protein [Mucilaginibacter sp. L3T2-6]MDO3641643.1 aminopeptidase P N-terminal domain-containing protein [Mucilaginibacter sp. L3T2-6]MDV6214137.1 aminopeptidase P N-terminal domain-containing protein [Mucilaginibacter sp. L3T2-6]